MKKKTKIHKKHGARFVLFIVIAIALALVTFFWFNVRDPNTTKFDAYISNPVSARFSNDVSAVIHDNIPTLNNNRNITPQSPVRISYDAVSGPNGPAFKYNLNGAQIAQGIKIKPAVRGKWSMPTPYEMVFVPEQNWPAGTKFDIKIDEKLFVQDARPDTRNLTFTTAPVSAQVDLFNVYPAQGIKQSVVGVAVISFDYPIQTKDLADKISMRIDGRNIDFTVKTDKYMRTAIVQTTPIQITDRPQTLRIKLNRIPDLYGKSRTEKITAKTNINTLDDFFKISDLTTITADDKQGTPQQLLLLNMTAAAQQKTDWKKYLAAYLLPQKKDKNDDEDFHVWARDEITPTVIKQSKKIDIKPVEFINPAGTYQYAFSYEVSDNVPRYVYAEVKPGISSENGFTSQNGITDVMAVAYPKRSVKIAGNGALLSLAGDKRIGIVARGGIDMAYINIYKIESGEINHLITQTYNLFSAPEFHAPWTFDAYDMSMLFQKKIPFSDKSMNKVNYASVNLGEYLDRTHNDKTGIFIIKAGPTQDAAEYGDARLILLTDLGIIRKINLDKTSSVFISSISSGLPAQDTEIKVLGRNGWPIWAGATDANGRADIPYFSHEEYRNEKEPVAIVARRDSDVSFIPYYVDNAQMVEYSKFDVGGAYVSSDVPLQSFIFSDRGIYRPGEKVTIGAIIENKTFTSIAGTPVKLEITDSRGRMIFDKKVSLPATGMVDFKYDLSTNATIGRYSVDMYSLNSRGRVQNMIGSGNFTVQEFVPDTMKIFAQFDNLNKDGWFGVDNITANVMLNNLYGTPAVNRKITADATLTPAHFEFTKYKDFAFEPNMSYNSHTTQQMRRTMQTISATIDDVRTDENGNATLYIKFDNEIPFGTYILNMKINGFDGGDGKSVKTILNTRVSNSKHLIGYRPLSDISYINRNDVRKIEFIALNSNGNADDLGNLKMRVIRRENMTSLVKDTNNNYKYQTVSRDTAVKESAFKISSNGTTITLDTQNGGTYYIEISDANGDILTNIEYFVAADENTDLVANERADLKIKLDAKEYKPGDTISIGIVAPYHGTGLITIERDKVYAHKWFTASTNSSTQNITLPKDFEGTGYVNVSFVRDINSRDIFTSPYTYAVMPFATKIDKHKIDIKLTTPDIIRDNKLTIKYETNKDSSIMIFAVNTGILQVANYDIPNPIKYFFQKAALQVETNQILSLLMPEYEILREVAKTGGSDLDASGIGGLGGLDSAFTNPFARKTLPPVAFYSDIIQTKAQKTDEISFDVPDYFNGTLSIYAVAATPGAIGAADTSSIVQSPVLISLSAPTFVAPKDKFTVNAIISNLTQESGKTVTALSTAKADGKLLPIKNDQSVIILPENSEKLWAFNVVAASNPGASNITISTQLQNDKQKTIASRVTDATLSVRPTSTLKTEIQTGIINDSDINIRRIGTKMYPDHLARTLYISKSPFMLARPLFMYLMNYDYSCTEQIVSRTLPYAIMPENNLLGTTYDDSVEKVNKTIQTLANRQNDDGSFGLWTSGTSSMTNIKSAETGYVTAYAMNFLTIARQSGFNVPQSMFARGIDFLREFSAQNTTSEYDAMAKAFAIYVLTNNDYVTTNYIDSVQEYANANIKNWQGTIIGPYIAASYKMLKQTDKAYDLISKYRENKATNAPNIFNNDVANTAITGFIKAKYFDMPTEGLAKSVQNYINTGNYDSFTAAAIIMMASAHANTTNSAAINISIFADNNQIDTKSEANGLIANIPSDVNKLRIKCETCNDNAPMFYTLIQQGFSLVSSTASNGIEISRAYYDQNGNEISSGKIGDTVDVKIMVRTRGQTDRVENAVITDLLPGGFIPLSDTINGDYEFNELREDRILIYTSLSRIPAVFSYRAQISVAGEFAVPPITAQDMYNATIRAIGQSGTFTVLNETD